MKLGVWWISLSYLPVKSFKINSSRISGVRFMNSHIICVLFEFLTRDFSFCEMPGISNSIISPRSIILVPLLCLILQPVTEMSSIVILPSSVD